jgi:hypothetical protein
MYTEDDLRTTLETLEHEAPDPTTVLSGLSSVRARRVAHRRMTVVVAAAVVAAAVAGGSIVVTNHEPAPKTGQHETPRGRPEWFRFPFSVGTLPGYTVAYRFSNVTTASVAWVIPGVVDDSMTNEMFEVHAFPKGEYDPSADGPGEPVTVHGAPASYRTGTQCQCSSDIGVPSVAWEYAPDTWVMVLYPRPAVEPGFQPAATVRANLLTIADAVRFDRTAPVRVPFRLGYLPQELRPTGPLNADVNTITRGSRGVHVNYQSARGHISFAASELSGTDLPVGQPVVQEEFLTGSPQVVVNLGEFSVTVSGDGVPEAELMRIARSASGVADLYDSSTWVDAEEALQPR